MTATLLLIAITAVASYYAWNHPEMYKKWIMNPYLVKKNKEVYRFITSGFIHADLGHLVFNMFSLYFMGQYLEQIFVGMFGFAGMAVYVMLYLLGIVISDVPTYLKHNKEYDYNALGASGGVASVIFSFILIAPVETIYLYFIPVPAFIFGALFLIYSYVQSKRDMDNVNHDAHFYGAVFGVLYTIAVMPEVIVSFTSQIINWRIF